MVLGLISCPSNLIYYTLVQFKKDRLMYWYKTQVLESYIGNVFVDDLKAFKSFLVDLQFYKV